MIEEFLKLYWKRILGIFAGVFLSIVYLFFGFWDMLFVVLLLYAGYSIGKYKEMNHTPLMPIQRLWESLNDRFRRFK
ncbi:DUF2273 domain-containing protein [Paenibacillus yanchengensis]|uniref:DUF2273 domain-containing protein n=1 Tax=Paenibacillus yanchengensis TaxID=2035833 RepID=A0ABW4YK53_9BACL